MHVPIVFAGIAPHGDEIIPVLHRVIDEESKKLMDAMIKFAEELVRRDPETIIIATPHNLRITHHIGVIMTSYGEGEFRTEYGSIHIRVPCNQELAKEIYEEANRAGLPVVGVNYGVASGDLSTISLDWGALIPLWFIKEEYERWNRKLPPIIVVTPSREVPREELVRFGEVIVDVVERRNIRVAFIASADHAHTHDPRGPYGFDENARIFDTKLVSIIQENKLEELLKIPQEMIERAKPDSVWQLLILHGVLKKTSLRLQTLTYACPTYFGMLVAYYL
mgnify:CR=1 FL=1